MEKTTLYMFAFSATTTTEGVIGSKLSAEETLEKIKIELTETFGEDNYEVVEFRPATDEEEESFRSQFEDAVSAVENTQTVH